MKKFIATLIGMMLIFSCSEIESKYSCGIAPSSPTDLSIENKTPDNIKLDLFVYENNLEKIGQVKIKSNEIKTICLENEGAITNGLYLIYNDSTSIIKLKSQRVNRFSLSNRTFWSE